MEKLKMHTPDLAEENYKKLAALFPDAVTEAKDENGNTVRAIDKDVLMQEINAKVVDDGQERYQFTWPDKRKAVVLANAPIAKTLRFEKEKSVGRDGTPGGTDSENIYIEGDNLDALKLLQETYLGKVKMIYIDPPYNTGNDFIYEDDFSQKAEDYADNSGQTDEEGNRLVQNSESNGRFHTDWLNMLYPRLRIAKDLLTEDGVIFISIDDNEQENLKKICDEIFGSQNFVFQIAWRRTDNQPNIGKIARVKEYILCFAKNISSLGLGKLPLTDKAKAEYRYQDEKGLFRRAILLDKTRGRYHYPVTTKSGNILNGPWMKTEEEFRALDSKGAIYWTSGGDEQPYGKIYLSESKGAIPNDFWGIEYGTNQRASLEVERLFEKRCFDFPKPVSLISALLTLGTEEDSIVIDFFSGSATTAQATMQVNAENRGNRKFILVQLPERCDSKSQAFKEGYKTICDIGEERIRRAGKKIKEETGADIDYGFRCFRVDSSNMKDVYYKPSDVKQGELDLFTDNIKEDRTPEDLLIQVMLDLGVLLSSKVEEEEIAGKKVFSVADGYLIACFDRDVTDDVVTAIARKHPFYAVFRDSSFSSDSVAANFEQIFDTYSPQTVRKVL
jgi:adenine-specific DNA-methyltransferase